ncbi:hypothetical protein [Flavobacterium sp. NRK1]|uniref:hypothetical protein n=1 Tax=Flavobacterium sp. NRK1 TaxID=2954929 RepID=UPI002093917E|nr:hypothetical protein [Flavobacterium sp. NRK1]MCO6146839.1 hypothetical protein [Flavobacterium sp. NRK1]
MIKFAIHRISVIICLLIVVSCGKEKTDNAEAAEQKQIIKDSIITKDTVVSRVSDTIVHSAVTPIASGCKLLHSGTFRYKDTDGDDVIVRINGESWTEEYKKREYIAISKIKWISDCEYENMLVMSTLPNFKLPPGTVMQVTIDEVKGKDVYITATAEGKSYHAKLTKI